MYPDVLWYGAADLPHVALSFDDGPDSDDTPRLVEVLARHNVRASFAFVGERAAARPDLVAQVAGAGHHLMIHGYRHQSFLLQGPRGLHQSLLRARLLIGRAAGCDPVSLKHVRAPYGHITPAIVRRLTTWGYRPVMGSIVPSHWIQSGPLTIDQVARHLQNGSLVVLHESLGGPPVHRLTDDILMRMRDRGLLPITVEQMQTERLAEDRLRSYAGLTRDS